MPRNSPLKGALPPVVTALLMAFAFFSLLYTVANIFLEDEKKFILHRTQTVTLVA